MPLEEVNDGRRLNNGFIKKKRNDPCSTSRIIYVFTKKHKCSNLQLREKKTNVNGVR